MRSGPVPRRAGLLGGLSRRRRAAVATALLAALVVVLATVGIRLVAARVGTDARSVPPQDRPGPVLLVPGYGGDVGALSELAAAIRRTGRDATVLPLPRGGTGDLAEQASVLDARVEQMLRRGAPSVDVIGYSAGGVVARAWVQDHDGAHKARRVITLGSPHHGAGLAAAGAAVAPDVCPTACQQLAPGSRFLAGLRTPVSTPPAWLALWTTQDRTVTPPDSARLEGAVSVAVQSICPGAQVSHGELPRNDVVIRIVLAALGPGPLATPDRSIC